MFKKFRRILVITLIIGTVITFIYIIFFAWYSYKNDQLGFSISYPKSLNLVPFQVDMDTMRRKYDQFCKQNGDCGGSRWPDSIVVFNRPNGRSAFGVEIFNDSVADVFGGIENKGKTYVVGIVGGLVGMESIKMELINDNLMNKIRQSLKVF